MFFHADMHAEGVTDYAAWMAQFESSWHESLEPAAWAQLESLWANLGAPVERSRSAACLARYALGLGRFEVALEWSDIALREADDPSSGAWAMAVQAEVRAEIGLYSEAESAANQVLVASSAEPMSRALATRALAHSALAQGAFTEALKWLDHATGALREDHATSFAMARVHLQVAETLLERDGPVDASAATARAADARDLIEEAGYEALRFPTGVLLAWVRAVAGDVDGARGELERLGAQATTHPLAWHVWAVQARLHERTGATLSAQRAWERAMESLEGLASALSEARRSAFWDDRRRALVRERSWGVRSGAGVLPVPRNDERRLERVLDIMKRLASEHDVDRLLERITDAAIELSGAQRGFVLLGNEEGAELETRIARDFSSPDDPHLAFSRSIAEAVLIDAEPIVTVDAASDNRLVDYMSVHSLRLKSVACLPIRSRERVCGVLYLEHRTRTGRFSASDVELLTAFADQAAIAISNAHMLARLEARRVALEQANEELGALKLELERLLHARTEELAVTKNELQTAREALRSSYSSHGIVGRSEAMKRVFAVVDRVRDAHIPVVVHGESGTGKELIARALHFGGPRSNAPFVPVNCAAIPDNLLESELFGYERGAFTGADRARTGLLVRASGGTLFLDEVGDMPMKMQIDLLRVLQERKVRPLGSAKEVDVDVRIISASNKSLAELVKRGDFREDLYYRLNVVEISLPALRERKGDIPLLCEHFLAQIAKRDRHSRKRLSREALGQLVAHGLPGNVRQLQHILMNACVMVEGDLIDARDLSIHVETVGATASLETETSTQALREAAPGPGASMPGNLDEFKDLERDRILQALKENNWNRVQAAKAIGMARRTFYRRLKQYEILI